MAKVLLVTGGSRGLGAAICRLGARDGYDVAVNYAGRADAAETVAADVRAAGRRAITVQADIGDEHAVAAMFDRCAAELGPVDAFVSNAGIIHKAAPLADIPVAEIRRIVDVDLTAHLICCREAVRRMSTRRGGRGGAIVVMSSMASELFGAGGFVPYGAAKGGIDVLTIGLGKEVAGRGDPGHRPAPGPDRHRDAGRRPGSRTGSRASGRPCRWVAPAVPTRSPRRRSGCCPTGPPM